MRVLLALILAVAASDAYAIGSFRLQGPWPGASSQPLSGTRAVRELTHRKRGEHLSGAMIADGP